MSEAQHMQREMQACINLILPSSIVNSAASKQSLGIEGEAQLPQHPVRRDTDVETAIRGHVRSFLEHASVLSQHIERNTGVVASAMAPRLSEADKLTQEIEALRSEVRAKDALLEKYLAKAEGWERALGRAHEANLVLMDAVVRGKTPP